MKSNLDVEKNLHAVYRGFNVLTTPPAAIAPKYIIAYSTQFGLKTASTSPLRRPLFTNALATFIILSHNSVYVTFSPVKPLT